MNIYIYIYAHMFQHVKRHSDGVFVFANATVDNKLKCMRKYRWCVCEASGLFEVDIVLVMHRSS